MTTRELQEVEELIDEYICSDRYEWTDEFERWLSDMDMVCQDHEGDDYFDSVYQKLIDFRNDCE